ncbi:glutaminyl-peptide cyclotransferase [Rhodococcus spelaei]|uniref:Glutaminyl-peptide cyclotransferase n=1 Tax=Rhodococcus spelaei TaxID=2546320 RepID=A0A541BPD1_9NOCA|nr:glutaminyl-peptide cyclotransferase [Rhodococcus spelaei]TQF74183.1 glutaminyl-peptide cyclotransferase [Rhodococcus spelaei]
MSLLRTVVVAALALTAATGCARGTTPADGVGVDRLRVEVVATHPHDPTAFTEGLEVSDGELLEGTGLSGQSYLSARDLASGIERTRVPVPDGMFGEGVTVAGDTVWQLTWQDGVALARDRGTLAERSRARFEGEGWGLCAQPDRLVMSNGSDTLTFRDRVTFAPLGSVAVTLDGKPRDNLNELECASDGRVYANVWRTPYIVRIDPADGRITAVIDASGLLSEAESRNVDVLNGIAQVPGTDRFLITGKYYPKLFEVRFVS